MKYRINYKRLLAFILLAIFTVLLFRGCVMSCIGEEQAELVPEKNMEFLLRVYDTEEQRAMTMTLEDYLVGVVAAEMPSSFEAAALRAQAVAARTFTAAHMKEFGGTPCGKEGCDLCTESACCQAWDSESALQKKWGVSCEKNRAKVAAAVFDTAGLVMTYDGKLIEALYHSTSGGRTEDSENVFASALPYLRGVDSPGEEDAPRYKRTVKFSRREFTKKLNAAFSDAKLSKSRLENQVEVLSRYESGRVCEIRLGDTVATGREFRKALSLDSANFSLEFSKDTVAVTTRGFGHGVGMSQLGANAMAKDGASYRDILTHYYTGVTVSSLSALE